jgi:hypothetical protein
LSLPRGVTFLFPSEEYKKLCRAAVKTGRIEALQLKIQIDRGTKTVLIAEDEILKMFYRAA